MHTHLTYAQLLFGYFPFGARVFQVEEKRAGRFPRTDHSREILTRITPFKPQLTLQGRDLFFHLYFVGKNIEARDGLMTRQSPTGQAETPRSSLLGSRARALMFHRQSPDAQK